MKNDLNEYRGTLISLCEKALKGEVKLKEFFSLWPGKIPKTEFVSELFDDLEEGIEHFPGDLLSGKKDIDSWACSYLAQKINIDLQLLLSGLSEESMLSLRRTLLKGNVTDENNIRKIIEHKKSNEVLLK